MKKDISTEQTLENIAAVLALLRGMPNRLEAVSEKLTPAQLTTPVGPGERTPTEILAHMLHCEAVSVEMITLALSRKEPFISGIHPERDLGKLFNLSRYEFGQLKVYYDLRRQFLLTVLNGLTEKQWSRRVRKEGKKRRESVYWLARGQALHEDDHLKAIEVYARR
jgi:hypothetical protein